MKLKLVIGQSGDWPASFRNLGLLLPSKNEQTLAAFTSVTDPKVFTFEGCEVLHIKGLISF